MTEKLIRDALGSPVPQSQNEDGTFVVLANGTTPNVDFSKIKLLRDVLGSPLPQQYYDVETGNFVSGNLAGDSTEIVQMVNNLDERVTAQLAQTSQQITQNLTSSNLTKQILMRGFVAHRGLISKAPENTLKAIMYAGMYGFSMVEVDPMKTSDGQWILMHDWTVDRTTNGNGAVTSMTLAQVKALIIDTPTYQIEEGEVYRVPTLEEAIREAAYWGIGINIDGAKLASFNATQADVNSVIALLDKYSLTHESIFVCPSVAMREMVMNASKDITIAWLGNVNTVDDDIVVASTYINNVVIGYSTLNVTDAVINRCHTNNIGVYVYGANTHEECSKWTAKNVNFIETDYILPMGGYKK